MRTIYVSHSTAFDFKNNLYNLLRQSKLNSQYKIVFPHENNLIPIDSQSIIKNSHFVLAEVSYPSTGQGIELGWANLFNIPVLCLFREDKTYSDSLKFVSNKFFSYKNGDELIIKLEKYLQ